MKFLNNWIWIIPALWGWIPGCLGRSDGEGSAGGKVFLALGICLAAVFLVFYGILYCSQRPGKRLKSPKFF